MNGYRIFVPAIGVYVGHNNHWTAEPRQARPFAFQTMADFFALCELELPFDGYTLEVFSIDPTPDPRARARTSL